MQKPGGLFRIGAFAVFLSIAAVAPAASADCSQLPIDNAKLRAMAALIRHEYGVLVSTRNRGVYPDWCRNARAFLSAFSTYRDALTDKRRILGADRCGGTEAWTTHMLGALDAEIAKVETATEKTTARASGCGI